MKIKNWTKFQHFKDRRPPWIKLYRDLLDDPDWHELDPANAKLLVSLWLIASEDETKQGILPDIKKISFRLRLDIKTLTTQICQLNHWLDMSDITMISTGYHVDTPETERETKAEAKVEVDTPPPEAKPATKGTKVPKDFQPNSTSLSLATSLGIDWEAEVEKFIDHHAQKGTIGKDWQAGFRTWLRKSVEFGTAKKVQKSIDGSLMSPAIC